MEYAAVIQQGARRWERWLRASFSPRYEPGALIRKIREDLRGLQTVSTEARSAQFSMENGTAFSVHEHVEARFLMSMALAQFILAVPACAAGQGTILVQHRGAWRRTGVTFTPSRDADARVRRVCIELAQDEALRAALMPLDFTSCTIDCTPPGFAVRLQHFGACELVGTVPRLQRYIKLSSDQRESLLASFTALRRVLGVQP